MKSEDNNMNEITERIARLRRLMETYHMDAYLVPTADFHESEYVGSILHAESTSPDLPVLRVLP